MQTQTIAFRLAENFKMKSLLILCDARWRAATVVETATDHQRCRARTAALDDSRMVREGAIITKKLPAHSSEPQEMARQLYQLMELGLQQKEGPIAWFRRVQADSLWSGYVSNGNLLAVHFSLLRLYMLLNRIYWFKLDRISDRDIRSAGFGRKVLDIR
jgi:hypothetical protein